MNASLVLCFEFALDPFQELKHFVLVKSIFGDTKIDNRVIINVVKTEVFVVECHFDAICFDDFWHKLFENLVEIAYVLRELDQHFLVTQDGNEENALVGLIVGLGRYRVNRSAGRAAVARVECHVGEAAWC